MNEPVAKVVLLGGERLAAPLAERTGLHVTPTTDDDHLDVVESLADDDALIIGLAAVPWPVLPELHADGSALYPYTGVVSWHALPALADRLAEAVKPGVQAGAHVLVTAPDPGPETEPSDVMFLRQVAEEIATRVPLPHRSIAWRGESRQPTAVDALTAVVEAHGRRDIVEVPVAPGTGADSDLMHAADDLGARLTCVDLGRATQIDLLTEVVRTVVGHDVDDTWTPGDALGGGGENGPGFAD